MNLKRIMWGVWVFAACMWAFNIFAYRHLIGDAILVHKNVQSCKRMAQLMATEPKSCYKVMGYVDEGNGLHSEAVRVDMQASRKGRYGYESSISLLIPEKQMASTGWSRLKEGDEVYLDYQKNQVLKGRSSQDEFSYLEPHRLAL